MVLAVTVGVVVAVALVLGDWSIDEGEWGMHEGC